VIAQTWVWSAVACAQPGETASRTEGGGEKASAKSSEMIKRVEPDILYVKDAKGETIPLINRTWEEIERLLELRDGGIGVPRPSFRVERLQVVGEAGPEYASLSVTFTIHASDKNWVRVPLRLGGVSLAEADEHQGEGEQFLEYDENSREYVSWFRGETDKPHVLRLKALVPLERSGGQTRLKVNFPRAVHSELSIKVPVAGAVAEVSPGAVLMPVRQQQNFTELKAIGLTSDFVMSWRENAEQIPDAPAAFDVSGQIVVQVERQSVQTKATLKVKAFGREFDSFRVRLPPGAALAPEQPRMDYTIHPLGNLPSQDGATDAQWVEIRRPMSSSERMEVQLTTRRDHEAAAAGKAIELSGFEVQGASRQWGSLAVAADHAWQVSFGKKSGVRQVDDLPENARFDEAHAGDWVASFEYYDQPYTLPLLVSPREKVISVNPMYLVYVRAHQLELQARLAYRIVGDKAFELEIDMPGWDVDVTDFGPADFVEAIVSKPGAPLTKTIKLKRAAFGEIVLTLKAQRKIAADAQGIEFELPRPDANVPDMAKLIVLAADNVELTPRDTELTGLSRDFAGMNWQAAEPPLKAPPHQQEALYYLGDSTEAKFAADFKINPRKLSVESYSLVHLDESGAQVSQTLSYQISYEPAESLLLDIPRELVDDGKLEFFVDDDAKAAPWVTVDEHDAAREDDAVTDILRRVRVRLPTPKIGPCELKLHYAWSGKPLIRQASVPLKIPLAIPAGGEAECVENYLDLDVDASVKAELLGEEWASRPNLDGAAGNDSILRFSANEPRSEITLNSTPADHPSGGDLIVDRAWIQTLLDKQGRAYHAIYRFESRDRSFSLILPQAVESHEFRLDGEQALSKPGQLPDERVVVWDEPGLHVLDVRYRVPAGAAGNGLTLELPKLGPGVIARRTYWQLILPRDEFLVAGPADLTPETAWTWQGFYWAREPLLDQQFLADWMLDRRFLAARDGAAQDQESMVPDPPPEASNQYLFSSSQIEGPVRLRLASRSALVLIGSGLLLVGGLLLIYVPALRRPSLLFVAAVCAMTAALIYPEATLLWLQAALVGGALACLAALLERNVARRRRREALIRGSSSSIVARSSTRTHARLNAPAPMSTETAAVAIELSAPDSRS
jgi:hypothetical protein